jgi:hypothetical protein
MTERIVLTKGALISSDESREVKKQHKTPCQDCPWRRVSIPRWLGGNTAEEWIGFAHGDGAIECHTRHSHKLFIQCAGSAIYRANVCKSPRLDAFRILKVLPLELKQNKKLVFARPQEFLAHHKKVG